MLPSIALDGLNSCNEFINITYETAVQMERIGIYPRGLRQSKTEDNNWERIAATNVKTEF